MAYLNVLCRPQFIEDRRNIKLASPACYSAQVSQLLNFSVQNSGPSTIISATWTRPLQLPASLTDQGYVALATGWCTANCLSATSAMTSSSAPLAQVNSN